MLAFSHQSLLIIVEDLSVIGVRQPCRGLVEGLASANPGA